MRKPRTRKDLEAHPLVTELWYEPDNGYWIQLAPGWLRDHETHTIHEDTIKELCIELNTNVYRCPGSPDTNWCTCPVIPGQPHRGGDQWAP